MTPGGRGLSLSERESPAEADDEMDKPDSVRSMGKVAIGQGAVPGRENGSGIPLPK